MTADRKLRILCLHGFWQNDVIFREKIGSFRKQFKALAEFDFVSAPLIPKSLDKDDREGARAWWFSKEGSQFSSRDVTDLATGFEESVAVVLHFIRENGPYDGIMGFSQGASMVHLLLALKQLGEVHFDVKFAILFSGFLSLSSVHADLTALNIQLPSFHVYGSSDNIVLKETSEILSKKFVENSIIIHPGGHFVPSPPVYKDNLKTFLTSFVRS